MENTATNIVTDQEMTVDDLFLRERREIIHANLPDKNVVATLIHTRWIGGRLYRVISTIRDGAVKNTVETELSGSEAQEFEQTWKEKWQPQLLDARAQTSEGEDWQDWLRIRRIFNSSDVKSNDAAARESELDDDQVTEEPDRVSNQTADEQPESEETKEDQDEPDQPADADGDVGMDDVKKTIVTEQEQVLEGVTLKDRRELTDLDTEGNSVLLHTRSIDDRVYRATVTLKDGIESETQVQTELTDEEVKLFEREWNEKWKTPSETEAA